MNRFDAVPGRGIGAATLPGIANSVVNTTRGAVLGEWLIYSSSTIYNPPGNPNPFAIQNWSDDDLQTAQPSDLIAPMTAAVATIDPWAVMLENGHIVVCFTASGTSCGTGMTGSAIQTYLSTDGGRTWTHQSTICPTFSGSTPTQALTQGTTIRLRQAHTGTANRLVMVYCDSDPTSTRDTVYRLAFSDNEGATWNLISTPATPTSGLLSAGKINDASGASLFEDGASNIQVFYSRMVTGAVPQVLQVAVSGGNLLPIGSPSVIANVPVQERMDNVWIGCGPRAIRLRTGDVGLYFSGTNFGRGEFHFMTSPTGLPGTWVNDRLAGVFPSGATGGFGGFSPIRKAMDGIDLLFQINGQPFSIIQYGA